MGDAMERTLLCFVEGRDREWEAICLDLDIAVQGESFDQVKDLLGAAIASYIQDAMKEGGRDRERLLNRSAPWWVRARYVLRFVSSALRSRKHDGDLHGSFEIPCHA